jgi:hypothetical protein
MTTRTNTARKSGGRKVKRLKQEAFTQLEEKANAIVSGLVNSSIKGHVLSAKLLVDLAEGEVDVEEAMQKRPLLTLRARLDAEPKLPRDAPIEPWDDDEETEAEDKVLATA